MAPRKKKRAPLRYSWALHFDYRSPEVRQLTYDGHQGLAYAQALAENHAERSALALKEHQYMPERLTVADLAIEDQTSPVEINRLIRRARIEIFGKDLSQSAIYYRLNQLQARRGRTCAAADCDEPIPPHEPISRLYCHEHRTPRSRTRRHREHKRATASKKSPSTKP
jgi:hypothetical protein